MLIRRLQLRLLLLLALTLFISGTCAVTSSAHLPLEARDDSGSQEEDVISTSYVLPNQIFNDGKPYYAGKDPVSGQLDFNAKKPAGIEVAANEVVDPMEKIVLSSSSPNIHDFLNLPVKYSSSKFVYPLVSSSYANLKYQGSNKNYVTNKKPTSVVAPITPAPNSHNYYNIPTTKLMAVPPTAPGTTSSSSSSTTTTTTSTTTSTKTTSEKPSTLASTARPVTSSSSSKYASPSRKPTLPTTIAPRLSVSTTRKKFVPTKKYSPTVPTVTTPMRLPDQRPYDSTTAPKPAITTTNLFATRQPPPPYSPSVPTTSTSTSTSSTFSLTSTSSTSQPVIFTQGPNPTAALNPIHGSTHVPNLDAADVYQTLGHKNTELKIEQRPSMTLADLFNSLAEEESAVLSNNQGNLLDAHGNLVQPMVPSQPSPFAMQHQPQSQPPPHTTRPTYATSAVPVSGQSPKPAPYGQDQKVVPASPESFSNEYVSYQVQQPNMLQYRPTINNVVISPGQNSASFVLGSQQQVGSSAFGTVEKDSVFDKQPPVQYGTVINEDISTLKRPGTYAPAPNPNFQQLPPGGNSNFHQNGNFGVQLPSGATVSQPPQRPVTASEVYQDAAPAPPSPYQQLPLVSSNTRPKPRPTPSQSVNSEQQLQQLPQLPQQVYQQEPQPAALAQTGHLQNAQQQAAEQLNQHHQHNQRPSPISSTLANSQDTKELLVSTNIRFPANDDQSDEAPALSPAAASLGGSQVNGHAQPLSLQQIQNTNPVVFPKPQDEETKLNDLHFPSDSVQIQKHEVLTMNQHKQKLNFPQLPEHIAPSQHMEPPPRLSGTSSEHKEVQKRPQPNNRPHGPPHQSPNQFAYNEYTRKPIPGIQRPNADRHLPNILPQFRPNAKISAGHPPAGYNQEPGNIRLNGQPPLKRPNNAPQFAHRRQPLMQQKRYPLNRNSEYPAGPPPPPPPPHSAEANRRVYRLPPYGGQNVQYVDRPYARRPPYAHAMRPNSDIYTAERHAAAASNDQVYKTLPTDQSGLVPERLAAFEEEDLVINDPPLPVTPSKDAAVVDETKLEPVVTLQMLQSQKKPLTLPGDDTGSGEIQVPAISETGEIPTMQNGLFVVYPMKGDRKQDSTDEPIDNDGTLPAIAHIDSSPSASDYQNTPFSVVRNQPQEPILKNKKPQSLQQQNKAQALKDKFPYPIEKPDSSYSELNMRERVPGVLIAPRIINGAYGPGGTENAPIAIAYTPTEPNHHTRTQPPNVQKYSNVNLASAVISEIRPDTQTEEGLSNDFDLRGQNLEKDFMAPFYPSANLGTATSAPVNGWNILPATTGGTVYAKNKINRADVVEGEANQEADGYETTTKVFEIDNFQPELQGGFKPIYPPGYKIDDEEENELQQLQPEPHLAPQEGGNMPVALASRMKPPRASSTTTTTTTTSTTSTTTTRIPTINSKTMEKEESAEKLKLTATTTAASITTSASASDSAVSTSTSTSTTKLPGSPTPTQRKKTTFETSLEALLFGDDEDFEDEARKVHNQPVSSPRQNVPRMGPRNLKMS